MFLVAIFIVTVVDCGSPPSISNGSPGTPSNTSFRGTVTYICNVGYTLSGSATVSCLASGNWSTTPTCTGIVLKKGLISSRGRLKSNNISQNTAVMQSNYT